MAAAGARQDAREPGAVSRPNVSTRRAHDVGKHGAKVSPQRARRQGQIGFVVSRCVSPDNPKLSGLPELRTCDCKPSGVALGRGEHAR
jgi:hypothetical protein